MGTRINEQIQQITYAINGTIFVYGTLAKRYNLNYNSLMVLYTLEGSEKCTQKDICDVLQLSKSTVHSILNDFVRKGYMTLQAEPGNRKEKIICLTPQGKIYLEEIMSKVHEIEKRVMLKLGSTLCSQLADSNTAFYEAFKAEVEHE